MHSQEWLPDTIYNATEKDEYTQSSLGVGSAILANKGHPSIWQWNNLAVAKYLAIAKPASLLCLLLARLGVDGMYQVAMATQVYGS